MSIIAPVRVRLRYPDIGTFVERFSANVTRGGVFIASRSPRAVGETFLFEVQLATGQVALSGEGKVIWIKEFDPAQPTKAHGMGVQFLALSTASRDLVQRMLKVKGTQRGPNAPRGLTQPLSPLANGGARPRVDTNVDLAAEFGLEESMVRRALDRAWGPGGRPSEDDLPGLMASEAAEPTATLPQALSELRRMLDPTKRRRTTGAFRPLEVVAVAPVVKEPEVAAVQAAPSENGVSAHLHEDS